MVVFNRINPNRFSMRPGTTLATKWSELRTAFSVPIANFNRSGQNQPDFWQFCAGDLKIYYAYLLYGNSTEGLQRLMRLAPAPREEGMLFVPTIYLINN